MTGAEFARRLRVAQALAQARAGEELSDAQADEIYRVALGRPSLSEKRAAAGRAGGSRSAEARRLAHGTAQPKQVRTNVEPNVEANVEATSKQTAVASVEPNPKQTAVASVLEANAEASPKQTAVASAKTLEASPKQTAVASVLPPARSRSGSSGSSMEISRSQISEDQIRRARATRCPADLLEQARAALAALAVELAVPPTAVELKAGIYRDYWMAQEQLRSADGWLRGLCKEIRGTHKRGLLVTAPGAEEHAERKRSEPPPSRKLHVVQARRAAPVTRAELEEILAGSPFGGSSPKGGGVVRSTSQTTSEGIVDAGMGINGGTGTHPDAREPAYAARARGSGGIRPDGR